MTSVDLAEGDQALSKVERLLFALALVVGAVLRLYELGRDGLWADEAAQAVWSTMPLDAMLLRLAVDTQAPLSFLLTKLIVLVFGDGETQMRLLSAFAGVASVWLAGVAARSLISPRAAWVAAALVATSPIHVHYSREARAYALLTALWVLALVAVDRLCRRPDARSVALLAVSLAMLIHTHSVAAFYVAVLLPLAPLCAEPRDRRRVVRALLTAALLAGVVCLPWLLVVAGQMGHLADAYAWLLPAWHRTFPWQLPWSLAVLTHGAPEPVRNGVASIPASAWASLAVAVMLAIAGFWRAVHRRRLWMLAAATLVPLAAVFLYSILSQPIYSVARVDVAAGISLLLLVAAGIAALDMRLGALLVVVHVALAAPALAATLLVDTRSQERTLATSLSQVMGEHDALVVSGPFVDTMVYYLRDARPGVRIIPFPLARERNAFLVNWSHYSDDSLRAEARLLAEGAARHVETHGGRRVFALGQKWERHPVVVNALGKVMRWTGHNDLHYLDLELDAFVLFDGGAPAAPALE